MNPYRTGTTEAALAAEAPAPLRRRLVAGWHFIRHLVEMVAAMLVGMALLGAAIGALGEPPGYDQPLVEIGLMGAAMAIPMLAWMRFRGHPWSDGREMAAAMLLPMPAVALPAALGLPGPTGHALMMGSHLAMIAGMVALMLYRRDRYTHDARGHRA